MQNGQSDNIGLIQEVTFEQCFAKTYIVDLPKFIF